MTTPSNCGICRGSGCVDLPIYRQAVARLVAVNETPLTMEASRRSYPCPECSETVPQSRLATVSYHSEIDSRIDDPDLMRHVMRSRAAEMGARLLRDGFIQFHRGPIDRRELRFPLRATIGVVSPNHVATLEERIAARQREVAERLISIAAVGINGWGSHYGQDWLFKAQAITSIKEALQAAVAEQAAWENAQAS
jgi:hypothetical protein